MPPSRATPLQPASAVRHWLVKPRRQASQCPQDKAIGLTTTGWPSGRVPANSWPSTTPGVKMAGLTGACRSVPQMPAAPTWIRTSPSPATGSGRWASSIRAWPVKTTACTSERPLLPGQGGDGAGQVEHVDAVAEHDLLAHGRRDVLGHPLRVVVGPVRVVGGEQQDLAAFHPLHGPGQLELVLGVVQRLGGEPGVGLDVFGRLALEAG